MQKLAAYQGQAHNASVIATFSHNGQRQNKHQTPLSSYHLLTALSTLSSLENIRPLLFLHVFINMGVFFREDLIKAQLFLKKN